MNNMQLSIMTISPEIAKAILEKNFSNRRVDKRRVDQYANDMIDGAWKTYTGEALKITKSNRFVDGQHRLLAIIKANIPVEMMVISGVDDDVFDVLDSGKPRSSADVFFISEIKNSNNVSAMINKYLILKSGKYSSNTAANDRSTNQEVLNVYLSNPDYYQLVLSYSYSWYHSFGKILSASIIGGYYLFFKDINENDAEKFMGQLCTGADISNSSILMLRQKLINDRTSKISKMPMRLKHALIIKCWNYMRQNKKVSILKYTEDNDQFPTAL
jgi:hypothetical protein